MTKKQTRKEKQKRQEKLAIDIVNTALTAISGLIILGILGLFISFLPDIMLVFTISDLWQEGPKDKLVGWKLHIHLFLHSYFIIYIPLFIGLMVYGLGYANIEFLLISFIFLVHINLDYFTHRKSHSKFFDGYYPLYPIKIIKIEWR